LATGALGSAIQVALYLHDFGATHFTDGMIAALAVYSFAATIGQLLRTTAVPLISGERPLVSGDAFGWGMGLIALLAAAICFFGAVPLAHLVAGSSTTGGKHVATTALRVMSAAIALQLAGAGLAVEGALRGRLNHVALAYAAAGVCGVIGYAVLEGPTGVQVLAWANVVSGVALVAVLLASLRIVPARPPRPARLAHAVAALFRSVPLPASFVIMYPLTLALIPIGLPGRVTLFGLAYTASSYLAGITAQALSMSEVVELTRAIGADDAVRRRIVLRSFRYSLLVAAPASGLAVIIGGPFVGALMYTRAGVSAGAFGTDMLLLSPLLIATLAVWATMPALLSSRDAIGPLRVFVASLALVAVHVVATLVGRAVWGFDGAVVAMAVAPATFVCFAQFGVARGTAVQLLRQSVPICLAVAAAFGVLALLAKAAGVAGAAGDGAAAVLGGLLYILFVLRFCPDEARTLLRLVGRS
jgi:hypothetical protein